MINNLETLKKQAEQLQREIPRILKYSEEISKNKNIDKKTREKLEKELYRLNSIKAGKFIKGFEKSLKKIDEDFENIINELGKIDKFDKKSEEAKLEARELLKQKEDILSEEAKQKLNEFIK